MDLGRPNGSWAERTVEKAVLSMQRRRRNIKTVDQLGWFDLISWDGSI